MKLALPILAMLVLAVPAGATPVIAVHWGSCPFPANEPTNRDAHTGSTDTITLTVTGLSGPVRGAQVSLLFSSPDGGLGEAWRYDDDGCEKGRLRYNAILPGGPCPFMDGANPIEFRQFGFDPSISMARIYYARVYEGFVANPSQTYTLARFDFDHSAPDTCGCVERPVCIHIVLASWLDAATVESQFAVAREYLNWNDPNNSSHCPFGGGDLAITGDPACDTPTPAHIRSWGSVKATYR